MNESKEFPTKKGYFSDDQNRAANANAELRMDHAMFYRKRAFENECAWARCSGALSIKPLGSRSRVRRTRGTKGIESISDWESCWQLATGEDRNACLVRVARS